jgi:hypothetical protein
MNNFVFELKKEWWVLPGMGLSFNLIGNSKLSQ